MVILATVAVGAPIPQGASEWDFWLPSYILVSFLLILGFVHMRLTWKLGVASFLAGTVWAWVDNAVGVLPAAALAVLLAVIAGAIRGRASALGGR
jgi:hypothetical protein